MGHGHGFAGHVQHAGDSRPRVTDSQLHGARIAVCRYARTTAEPQQAAAELLEMLGIDSTRPPADAAPVDYTWMQIRRPKTRPERAIAHLVLADTPRTSLCRRAGLGTTPKWQPPTEGARQCLGCLELLRERRVSVRELVSA